MGSFKALFSICCSSDYYKNKKIRDVSIKLDDTSMNIFKRYNLDFIDRGGEYEVVWLVNKIKNIDECAKNIFRDVNLTFFLNINTSNVFRFLEINTNKIYKLENTNNKLLHKGEYLSDEDLTLYKRGIGQKNMIGIIKINMNLLFGKNDLFSFDTKYFINIKPIESFLNIRIVDEKKVIKDVKNFFFNGKIFDFLKIDDEKYIIFMSSKPISLREISMNSLSIEYTTSNTNGNKQMSVNVTVPIYFDKIIEDNKHISNINMII